MNLSGSKQNGFSVLLLVFAVLLVIIFGVAIFFLFGKVKLLEKSIPLVKVDQKGVSFVYLKEVPYLKTGSEVCYEAGLSCLGMSSSRIVDNENKFYGFITPMCDSQVKKASECVEYFDTEYAIDKVKYVRSPNAESNQTLEADFFCLFSKEGKVGKFQYAYCVQKE